nr:sensor histidine kinase [uncultured Cohaesibacter sp.]
MKHNPKRLTQKSMRHRLLLAMSAGFMAILTIICAGLWGYAQQAANESFDRLLHGAALAILERANMASGEVRVDIPYSAFEILGLAKEDRIFYRIFTQDNQTITASHNLLPAANYKPSERPVYWDDAYSGETVRFMQQSRLLTGDAGSKWLIVQFGQTCIARQDMIADLFWRGFAVALFITVVGLMFVWIAINRALHPLIDVEENLRQRDISDFTPLPVTPPREVASLILSINGFISRLKNNLDHSQIFIADVTHQIRTALSALQGQLELASREQDADLRQDRVEKAERQSRQTIHLTNQLLAHAMVIHRADQRISSDIHLAELLKTVLQSVLREHIKSDIDFSVSIAAEIENGGADADLIAGDSISLREAIRNVIDNAVKHGPENNRIDISLYEKLYKVRGRKRRKVILQVDDAGPGIHEATRGKVLERFYTTEKQAEGSGLGLSIVDEVMRSHGARLSLGDSALGGLRVRMEFDGKIGRAE